MGTFTQDMPPQNGYAPIQVERLPTRILMTGKRAIVLTTISTIIGHYLYVKYEWKREMRLKYEMLGSMKVVLPLLFAERDRRQLKLYKKNIEREKELMRYYPAWEVGTWFGKRIYKTVPENELLKPHMSETVMHFCDKDVGRAITYGQATH